MPAFFAGGGVMYIPKWVGLCSLYMNRTQHRPMPCGGWCGLEPNSGRNERTCCGASCLRAGGGCESRGGRGRMATATGPRSQEKGLRGAADFRILLADEHQIYDQPRNLPLESGAHRSPHRVAFCPGPHHPLI